MRSDWPVEFDTVFGCWLWIGKSSDDGYPWTVTPQGYRNAHRIVYEHERGVIPVGKELDHLCKRRSCVAPAHMEPVTHLENMRLRGRIGWARRVKREACSNGHRLWENGRRTPEGGIVCRTCSGV